MPGNFNPVRLEVVGGLLTPLVGEKSGQIYLIFNC